MKDNFGTQAIRLQVANGKMKIGEWSVGSTASFGVPSHWGGLYAICHVIDHGGGTERLCHRMEGVAHETYLRAPGGVINKLRQALRNVNRYLYLRNTMREGEQKLLAGMSCLAIRGTDAYTCGVGPHVSLIISGGRVRSFVNPLPGGDLATFEGWPSDDYVLGCRSVLDDPRFSYRQALPGDVVVLIAADDVGVVQHISDELAAIADEEEIRAAAQQLARLIGRSTDLSALLIRPEPDAARLQEQSWGSASHTASTPASSHQIFVPSRRPAKGVEVRQYQGRSGHKKPIPSKKVVTRQDKRSMSEGLESGLAAALGRRRGEVRQSEGRQSHQLLQQTGELCRAAGAFLLSLVYALLRGGLGLFRSGWRVAGHLWGWIRVHRVLEKLGRGCELALIGVWEGSKGLFIRILPELQSSSQTYSASARPMARTRLVRFHPSRRSRAAIGALIMVGVFAVVVGSALRITSQPGQANVESLLAQAEQTMLLAESETSIERQISLLVEASDLIDQAGAVQADDIELSEVSTRLERQLDAATGVVRVSFGVGHTLNIAEEGPERLVINEGQLYVLDKAGQRIYRYVLDEEGNLGTNQEPWTWELQGETGTVSVERILDIEWVDAVNGRLTPALLLLTEGGSLMELNSSGDAREVSITDVLPWEDARAIRTYYGNLYVLDMKRENIIKYIPTANDYTYPPVNYFQESPDIQWANVTDMAIDGSVYLLRSNGFVMKFASGARETFTQHGLYPPLEDSVAIFASTDSGSVFVAEPDQARIVEFSAAGEFIRQFCASNDEQDPFKDLVSFAVDQRHGRLVVATATHLFSAPLPALQ